jgi:glycosyltransferase involved in cell wall biosynthesis
MRIMHIISGDLWAGAEVQVYHCINGLKSEFDISAFCVLFNHGQLEKALRQLCANVAVFDESVMSSAGIIWKMRQAMVSFKPDVIHVHHIKEHYVGYITRLLVGKRVPIVRTVHGLSAVSPNLSFVKRLRSTIVVAIDGVLKKYCTTALIAVSKKLEIDLLGLNPKGEVVHIYNALNLGAFDIDRDKHDAVRKKYKTEDVFWIGTAVRLVKPKNIKMLIQAGLILAKEDLPFQISIFGDGPLKNELAEEIKKKGLNDKITLHGFKKNLKEEMAALDVFVLCSLHEGMPMALLEAMALGSLVVCTAVGGMKEIIDNGKNGILVPSQDVPELGKTFIELIKSGNRLETMRKNARLTIEQLFNIERATDSLYRLYASLTQP